MYAHLLRAALTAVAVIALSGSPAHAQWADPRGGHDEGYRDGAQAGGDDAREGRPFEYQRHRDYRAADNGYQRRDGRRDDYKEQYRAGFIAGYRDGYYSSGGRGAGRGPDRGRVMPPLPRRPGSGPLPGARPGYDARPGYGRPPVVDIAYGNGFEEGYRKGLDDGRDGDRPDPSRHSRYRNADQGYRRDYGPRRVYQQSYRAAFEQGYEQGYRESRGRGRGGPWD